MNKNSTRAYNRFILISISAIIGSVLSFSVACAATQQFSSFKNAMEFDYCAAKFQPTRNLIEFDQWKNFYINGSSTDLIGRELAIYTIAKAGYIVTYNAETNSICQEIFTKGNELYNTTHLAIESLFLSAAHRKWSKDTSIASIQKKITDFWIVDQVGRTTYIGLQTDDKKGVGYWARQKAAASVKYSDTAAKEFLEASLENYDWIDRHRFGGNVSHYAWLIAQHADDYPEFQRAVLTRMEKYLNNGGVQKEDYAYLWDRVAINSGKPQRYGTQPIWECTPDKQLTLQPIEDPDHVNERRKQMGLNTVEEGLAQMAAKTCL
ncbi:MAG: DUF6624 domain-containing protein [bacterium]